MKLCVAVIHLTFPEPYYKGGNNSNLRYFLYKVFLWLLAVLDEQAHRKNPLLFNFITKKNRGLWSINAAGTEIA
jgi:hypothetical protein